MCKLYSKWQRWQLSFVWKVWFKYITEQHSTVHASSWYLTWYFSAYWTKNAHIFCPFFFLMLNNIFERRLAIFYCESKFWPGSYESYYPFIVYTSLNVLKSHACVFYKSIGQTVRQNQMGKKFINRWERFLIFNNFTLMMCLLGVHASFDRAFAHFLCISLYPYSANQMHVECKRQLVREQQCFVSTHLIYIRQYINSNHR